MGGRKQGGRKQERDDSAGRRREEFEKYREIPEYQLQNKGMSLSAFQFIYWWEWTHRFLGRMIGFVVALPLLFFWVTGRLEPRLRPRLLLLLALGGLQGAVGWWMVKSGLVDRVDVSQYRLAIHLTLACIIFAYGFWLARGLAPHSTTREAPPILLALARLMAVLVLAQIFLGGLVAGLDAGLAANDWPTMLGAWMPEAIGDLSPAWRNLFENPIAVQFDHRIGAYLLLLLFGIQAVIASRSEAEAPHKRRTLLVLAIALLQATIGILTVLWEVPLATALLHQAVAVILLGAAIAHWRGLKGSYPAVTAMEARG